MVWLRLRGREKLLGSIVKIIHSWISLLQTRLINYYVTALFVILFTISVLLFFWGTMCCFYPYSVWGCDICPLLHPLTENHAWRFLNMSYYPHKDDKTNSKKLNLTGASETLHSQKVLLYVNYLFWIYPLQLKQKL